MNLKEKSIKYWNDKLKDLQPKKGVTDMTSPERKEELKKEYEENLKYVESKPLSWFERFEHLANAQTTYASCGGHTKAQRNLNARNRIEAELNCDVPTDKILYSFGTFNGIGAV